MIIYETTVIEGTWEEISAYMESLGDAIKGKRFRVLILDDEEETVETDEAEPINRAEKL